MAPTAPDTRRPGRALPRSRVLVPRIPEGPPRARADRGHPLRGRGAAGGAPSARRRPGAERRRPERIRARRVLGRPDRRHRARGRRAVTLLVGAWTIGLILSL